MHIDSAPCHAYHPLLGSGLEWEPGHVKLWIGGEVVATASYATASAQQFFYNLAFVECFPEVAAWWMRSEWAGRVRVSAPFTSDGEGIMGTMRFDSEDTPALPWMIDEGTPVTISVPLPRGGHHVNLFLKSRLALSLLDVFIGVTPVSAWKPITGLVHRDQLYALLTETHNPPTATLPTWLTVLAGNDDLNSHVLRPRRWAFADLPDLSLRELFCHLVLVNIIDRD